MKVYSPTELAPVDWSPRPDGFADIRIRRNIEKVTQPAQGDQPEQVQWAADEVYVCAEISEAEAAERQDELFEAGARASMTTEQRIEELENAEPQPVPVATASAVAFMLSATPMSDEQAVEFADVFPEWEPGKSYKADVILRHNGELYRTAQAHTSSAEHEPGEGTESLYTHISITGGVEDWQQPTGAHDAYEKGKEVRDPEDGQVYRSKIDANVWGPPHTMPDYWELA